MICGSCHKDHDTVAEVRACYGISTTPAGLRSAAPATEKQLDFIATLERERDLTPHQGSLTKAEASDLITDLLAIKKPVAPHTLFPEAGMAEEEAYLAQRKPPVQVAVNTENYSDIPAGYYAVLSMTGNNDLDFFRVDKPTEGKWAGYIFVKRVIGGHPDVQVRRGEKHKALQAIRAAGPELAGQKYGQEIGRCWKCHRHLTDETSRRLGIGPDCRAQLASAAA